MTHIETSAKKVVPDSAGVLTHKVEDVLDLDNIRLTLEKSKPKAEKLRATLSKLEGLIFDAAGDPLPSVRSSSAIRNSLINVYFATKSSLADLENDFSTSLLTGTPVPEVKIPGDLELFQNSINELNSTLEKYMEKTKRYFSPSEKAKIWPEEAKKGAGSTAVERELLKKKLDEIFRTWFVADLSPNEEPRFAAIEIIGLKLDDMEADTIDYFKTHGDTEVEALARWENFRDLVNLTFDLVDCGIMNGKTIDIVHGTAVHDRLLKNPENGFSPTNKSRAIKANRNFNRNPLVNVRDIHLGEQHAPNMGIVQMICFASYQRMKSRFTENFNPRKMSLAERVIKELKESFFSRNKTYDAAEEMENLIDFSCEMEEVPMWTGEKLPVNVKKEFNKYPEEIQLFIKQLAMWKFSRDDLGTLAGTWHLGRFGASYKFNNGGIGRPAGILGAIIYQISKKNLDEAHLAASAFITPEFTEFMPKGKDANDPWPMGALQDKAVAAIEHLDEYEIWENPQLEGVLYKEHGDHHVGLEKYSPKHWWEDFPQFSEFMNLTEDTRDGDTYTRARDAMLRLIERAAKAPSTLNMEGTADDLAGKITSLLSSFTSDVGRVMSYSQPYNDGSAFYTNFYHLDTPNPNQRNYMMEFTMAAFKYYLSTMLLKIPLGGKATFFGRIPRSFGEGELKDYDIRYNRAVKIIREVINGNSTISGYFHRELTGYGDPARGNRGFIDKNFRKQWKDIDYTDNKYKSWELKHVPKYQEYTHEERVAHLMEPVKRPADATKGWKSNTRGAEPEAEE